MDMYQNQIVSTARRLTFHKPWQFSAALDTTEGRTTPCAASHKLEPMEYHDTLLNLSTEESKPREWTYGLVEISCPAAATPMIVLTPQPLWQASRAWRMT